MQMTMIRKDRFGIKERGTFYFQGSTRLLLRASQIPEMLQSSTEKIVQSFDEFLRHGSGWILESIDYLHLFTAKYARMHGNRYIPTPKANVNKEGIINPQNKDEHCVIYCLALFHHYYEIDQHNAERPTQLKKFLHEYNFDGCSMPMEIDDLSTILR